MIVFVWKILQLLDVVTVWTGGRFECGILISISAQPYMATPFSACSLLTQLLEHN